MLHEKVDKPGKRSLLSGGSKLIEQTSLEKEHIDMEMTLIFRNGHSSLSEEKIKLLRVTFYKSEPPEIHDPS